MIDAKNKLVTIFGGGGFIGRYVCEELFDSEVRLRVAGRNPLSRMLTGHVGRKVILAKVQVGGRRGTLRFTATVKRRVVGRCNVGRVGARKTVTCKITMKRPYPLTKVRFTARFVSMGIGPLHVPKLPGIPGIDEFEGHAFHTSRWDYAYTGGDPTGGMDF